MVPYNQRVYKFKGNVIETVLSGNQANYDGLYCLSNDGAKECAKNVFKVLDNTYRRLTSKKRPHNTVKKEMLSKYLFLLSSSFM